MKKTCLTLALMLVFGCAPPREQIRTSMPYEADILIGQSKANVITKAEKIFGLPRQTGMIFPKTSYEVEIRRYTFTNVFDFVMYFHKDVFVQAALMPCEANEYPSLRGDYQSISVDKPGPVQGYMLLMNEQEVVVDTIQSD